jgi:hypothetical protein
MKSHRILTKYSSSKPSTRTKRKRHSVYLSRATQRRHNVSSNANIRKNKKNKTYKIEYRGGTGGSAFSFFRKKLEDEEVGLKPSQTSQGKSALYQDRSTIGVDSVMVASAVGATTAIAKGAIVGLTALSLISPVGPAIAVVLVLAHQLAEIYKTSVNLNYLMQDIMIILTSIYKLNKLIDKSSKVMWIYMLNTDFDKIVQSNNVNIDDTFETTQEPFKSTTKNPNSQDIFTVINTSLSNKLYDDTKNNSNLFGKIRKDPDIQARLYDKLQYLTVYLFSLSPTNLLTKLYDDQSVKQSGIGILIQNEFKRRGLNTDNGSPKNRFGFFDKATGIGRIFMRTLKGKSVTNKMVQDLCVINSYFNLMKSQYDFEWDYYARMLKKEEYDKIWNCIQNQQEYTNFMVKEDSKMITEQIFVEEQGNFEAIKDGFGTKQVKSFQDEHSETIKNAVEGEVEGEGEGEGDTVNV